MMTSENAGVAYLAVATTLPAYRNRGCEQALIHHALGAARARGCEVCAQCEVDSPSARNFERFGMRLAYHKAIWQLRADRGPGTPPVESLY